MLANDAEAVQLAQEAEMMDELEGHQTNHAAFKRLTEALLSEVSYSSFFV